MSRKTSPRFLLVLVLAGVACGCHAMDTFNPYPRISVLDFQVAPQKTGQVAPESLAMLKDASMRWLQNGGLFSEVAGDNTGGPETVFVEGIVAAYRPHRRGTRALAMFSGVDVQGESYIMYRFFDSTGRTLLQKNLQTRFMNCDPGMDPTAEAAGCELSRMVSWYKNIRS